MFGNVTSLDASAAIFLVLVSAAPAGAHQGFGVAKYQDWVTKYLLRWCVNLGCSTGCWGRRRLVDSKHFCKCETPLLEKAGGETQCRSGMKSGPYIMWFVSVLRGTRAWVRWERDICQLMYLKSPDVLMPGSEHGTDIDLEEVLFWITLSLFLHFSSSGSLYWALNLCPPLRLWSEMFQYTWSLWSSCRWSLELCTEQFLHLDFFFF